MNLPNIAYLTGEYPRATDTFIQREVVGLRAAGLKVSTCSIRKTDASHHVGPEQKHEATNTFHVLAATLRPSTLLSAHFSLIRKEPKRWGKALMLAARTSPGGVKAFAYQMIYLAEAGVLARHMQDNGITHLHNHIAKSSCTVAMLASALSGIPFSFTLHGPDIFFEPIHWRLDEKIARASFVACISHFCRSQAMSFSSPEQWRKLHIVHCGVEPARYAEQPQKPTGKRLLFVGRLAAVKGLPVLIEALQNVTTDGITLQIVGDGPDRDSLQASVTAAGLNKQVSFLGYRSQDDVATLLSESDILVLPSFAEGLPVVLMEAMAASRPVIATRIAGTAELVEDGVSGKLVSAGDVEALTAAIDELATSAQKAEKMGQAGRQAVLEGFQSDIEARRLATLFSNVGTETRSALRPEPLKTELEKP
ncbi:glycosyltransferase family 4 protein [Lentibacter algarum]|uniref:glycosyltransferase family 4 protein n=1 Tax=Lentibacter algarum TaxID=576131 RepID=UPI001C08D7AC|nr:glycosyltransferase family 4 protein [Lentibacter algarum]MBU2983339.1 glycosyltransferase family 4 protein [Lentibacter algarum]